MSEQQKTQAEQLARRIRTALGEYNDDELPLTVVIEQMRERLNRADQSRPAVMDGYIVVPAESARIAAGIALRSLDNKKHNIQRDTHLRKIDKEYHLNEIEQERQHIRAIEDQQPEGGER